MGAGQTKIEGEDLEVSESITVREFLAERADQMVADYDAVLTTALLPTTSVKHRWEMFSEFLIAWVPDINNAPPLFLRKLLATHRPWKLASTNRGSILMDIKQADEAVYVDYRSVFACARSSYFTDGKPFKVLEIADLNAFEAAYTGGDTALVSVNDDARIGPFYGPIEEAQARKMLLDPIVEGVENAFIGARRLLPDELRSAWMQRVVPPQFERIRGLITENFVVSPEPDDVQAMVDAVYARAGVGRFKRYGRDQKHDDAHIYGAEVYLIVPAFFAQITVTELPPPSQPAPETSRTKKTRYTSRSRTSGAPLAAAPRPVAPEAWTALAESGSEGSE